METHRIDRRTLLRTGGLAAGALAAGGLGSGRADAARAAGGARPALELGGPLVGWVVLDLDRGGLVQLVEIDPSSKPVRTIATEALPLMPPASAVRRAHMLAVRTVAASWGVRPETCLVAPRRIAHPASGRSIGYAVWTDFA